MQYIHPCFFSPNPGRAMVWALWGLVHFLYEISQYIMMYHANPWQNRIAMFLRLLSPFSSKVLKSPYEFVRKFPEKIL